MFCFIVLDLGGEGYRLSLDNDKQWDKIPVRIDTKEQSRLDNVLISCLKNAGYEVAALGEIDGETTNNRAEVSIVGESIDPLYWMAEKKRTRQPFFFSLSSENIRLKSEQTMSDWFEEFEQFYFKSGLARKSILILKDTFRPLQSTPHRSVVEEHLMSEYHVLLPDTLRKDYTPDGGTASERALYQKLFGVVEQISCKQENL